MDMLDHSETPTASTSTAPSDQDPRSSLFTASSSSSQPISRDRIGSDDSLLIKLPSGIIKPIKLNGANNNTLTLGKLGSFKASELVGKVYGQTYEILDGGALEAVKTTLSEIGRSGFS